MISKKLLKDKEVKQKLSEDWVKARILLEMIGKPKDFLVQKLEEHILNAEKVDGVKIISYEIEEPEEKEQFFSTFAEVELLFKDQTRLIYFCFEFLPAHIEITDPEEFLFTAKDLTDILNDLIIKLHSWDKTVRVINEQNKILYNNQSVLIENMLYLSLRTGPKTIQQLERDIGLPSKSFWDVVDKMKKKGLIVEEGSKLALARRPSN
ncbi:MAG: hypothetical protein PWP03_453 [Candidatus Woesearchaeota archaeon]|nr:hypothetical protein [Candidatus Woesearchaeota archaeon]MDN5327815.1 hypothetical protein [Candidatus Woesearchaeota archaeon]